VGSAFTFASAIRIIATKVNDANVKIYLCLRYTLNPRIFSRTASGIACGSVDMERLRHATKWSDRTQDDSVFVHTPDLDPITVCIHIVAAVAN
jgi:hypothetical protein